MIISFNSTIFQTQDSDIQAILANILVELLKDRHFINPQSIKIIFFDQENKYIFNENNIAKLHLSEKEKRDLKNYINNNRKPITQLHISHLTQITIGTNLDLQEIHPHDAYKIIKERSKIIVENGINDWKFIKGICQKYSSGGKRRSIYELLDKAIKNGIIESDNAGGIGEVTKITQRWIDDDRYHNIYRYKLMAIFDSDKQMSKETPHTSQIEYFKRKTITSIQSIDYEYQSTDLIIWHILYKRKIENYIPLEVLFNKITSITEVQKNYLKSKTNHDLDFMEYNKENIGIGGSQIKAQFPEMFLSHFSYRLLEQRCEHHKVFLLEANENVSEIEQILLKIAKII